MKKTQIRVLLMLCFSVIMAVAMGQQKKTYSGTVKDDAGNPVSGVTVQVKGTQTFALTDGAGTFSISSAAASPSVKPGLKGAA